MNYYFITGTSSGIGKALAEILLQDNNTKVTGIGRHECIEHANYTHFKADLSNTEQTLNFEFEMPEKFDSVCLINNSGALGYVNHVGKLSNTDMVSTYNLNTLAPSILTNKFVATFGQSPGRKVVLNVSSGAGRHAIESWAAYCASKAALDMFSQVAYMEQMKFNAENPVYVFSVAPGIVDTKMQDEIRAVAPENFSEVGRFVSYKTKNQLSTPISVALQLREVLLKPEKFTQSVLDVREF